MSEPLIRLKGIERRYQSGEHEVTVLHPLDLAIDAGEMVAIVGASGSGKSTLMNLLGCLDHPSGGQYLFRGQDTATLDALSLARLRCHHFGFIFQRYHLLSDLDALGNAEIPAIYAGLRPDSRRERASRLLARLGLSNRLHHRPGQLSGGQQQRVSIARALVNGGEVILADEPTGALDSHSGQEVMAILHELHAEGHTVIMVTHDAGLAVIFPAWLRYAWREHPERFLEFSAQAFGVEPVDSDADELDVEVTPEQAIEYAVEATIDELQDFFVSLGMPRALSEFGVTEDDIEKMIPGLKINRGELFGSFRKLTLDNARKIYRSAL